MHGAGSIKEITNRTIENETYSYYTIEMPGEVKVFVPTAKAEDIGVRRIIDKETAGKVISVLEQDSTEMSMKWNKRYRDNVEKLKTGDAFEVADIVRNLSFKQKEKGLSTTEKKMLNNAKQILVSELVLSEEKEQKEIEELVENKINASYELHIAASEELPKVVGIPDDVANSKVVKKFIPTNNNTANRIDRTHDGTNVNGIHR